MHQELQLILDIDKTVLQKVILQFVVATCLLVLFVTRTLSSQDLLRNSSGLSVGWPLQFLSGEIAESDYEMELWFGRVMSLKNIEIRWLAFGANSLFLVCAIYGAWLLVALVRWQSTVSALAALTLYSSLYLNENLEYLRSFEVFDYSWEAFIYDYAKDLTWFLYATFSAGSTAIVGKCVVSLSSQPISLLQDEAEP